MKQKKKMSTSKIILIVAIIAIVAFTIASFILQFMTGTEISSTLIEYWYKFWTVEIVVLSGIKVSKVFKARNNIYEENLEEEVFKEIVEEE